MAMGFSPWDKTKIINGKIRANIIRIIFLESHLTSAFWKKMNSYKIMIRGRTTEFSFEPIEKRPAIKEIVKNRYILKSLDILPLT